MLKSVAYQENLVCKCDLNILDGQLCAMRNRKKCVFQSELILRSFIELMSCPTLHYPTQPCSPPARPPARPPACLPAKMKVFYAVCLPGKCCKLDGKRCLIARPIIKSAVLAKIELGSNLSRKTGMSRFSRIPLLPTSSSALLALAFVAGPPLATLSFCCVTLNACCWAVVYSWALSS